MIFVFFFFFQAEDGIRDLTVTGVQTCALPICGPPPGRLRGRGPRGLRETGQLFRAPDRALEQAVPGLGDRTNRAHGRSDRLASGKHSGGRRNDGGARRLPHGQPHFPSARTENSRHPRLGALHARPPARGFFLSLHELAYSAWAVSRHRWARPRGARHSERVAIHWVILRARRAEWDRALGFLSRLQSLPDRRDPAGRDETRAGGHCGERPGARGGRARPAARRAGMDIRGKNDVEKIALYLPEPDRRLRLAFAAAAARRTSDAGRRAPEQLRQPVRMRHIVPPHELDMAERKRREMNQVEDVAGEAREPGGNQNSQSGPPSGGPQSRQVVADAPRHAASELDFVPVARIALLAQRRDRLAELANV